MASNCRKLGGYIREIDRRNTENRQDNLLGLSVTKRFIPSIANTVGTDFRKYKIVEKGQFAYIPDTSRRGDKIAIALLEDWDSGLVSNVYTVFEVVGEGLLPKYLELWFRRPEFDRYARFKSHGSVREIFDWGQLRDVELPVPSIAEQQRIVDSFNAIERRIDSLQQLNDKLAAMVSMIRTQLAAVGTPVLLCERTEMQYGYTQTATCEPVGPKFLRITDISSGQLDWDEVPYCSIDDKQYMRYQLEPGDTVVARTGISAGVARFFGGSIPKAVFASFLVRVRANNPIEQTYTGLTISSSDFFEYIQANAGGSAQPQANPPLLGQYEYPLPGESELRVFNRRIAPIINAIETNEQEITLLKRLQKSLLSNLSKADV